MPDHFQALPPPVPPNPPSPYDRFGEINLRKPATRGSRQGLVVAVVALAVGAGLALIVLVPMIVPPGTVWRPVVDNGQQPAAGPVRTLSGSHHAAECHAKYSQWKLSVTRKPRTVIKP